MEAPVWMAALGRRALEAAMAVASCAATVEALKGDPLVDGKKITACILKLTDDVVPFVAFAFILLGAIVYISAAEDTKQRILGRKYAEMGIVGIVCVKALVGIAALPFFGITPGLCVPD
jgi:hypothetical protein